MVSEALNLQNHFSNCLINVQLHLVPTLDRAQTGIVVLRHPHAKQDKEIVTLIPTVLEIWFVETTIARTSIQLPKVQLTAV